EESDPKGRVPDDLRGLVLSLLAKNPDERPGSAEELAESLRRIQEGYPLQGNEMEAPPAPVVVAVAPPEPEPEEKSQDLPLILRQEDRRMLWDEEDDPDAVEPDLLGPARRQDWSWGSLAAGTLILMSLLGAFLWYQRPSAPSVSAPPYAPPVAPDVPADVRLVNPLEEQDAPPAEEPQVIEELPIEPEPRLAEPLPAPEPIQPVQTVEIEPEPTPAPRATRARPERPRPEEPARIAEARPEPPAPRRTVRSGPPESRMAGVLRPGPGVEMPIPLDFPSARYPASARGRGLRVDVHLDILVGEQGQVLEAVVREGDTSGLGFNEAAVQAALAARFQPATRWDLPGKAWTELIIQFEEGS
ncbi:MAG TPA: TonB family protein, partial [Thermoanaerobaculia bacterium]|nr:TonB family protein [Thermoanaerobaculia bacterium]